MAFDQTLLDNVRKLRLEDKGSLPSIVLALSISKSTASKYIHEAEKFLTEAEKSELHRDILKKGAAGRTSEDRSKSSANNAAVVEDLKRRVAALQEGRVPLADGVGTHTLGYMAEHFVRYALTRRGLEVLQHVHLEEACDFVVRGPSGKYYRAEVKATTAGTVKLSRTKFVAGGGYRANPYSALNEIDAFICVDLVNELVFVIPCTDIQNLEAGPAYSLTPRGEAWKYLNGFQFFK